MAGIGTEAEVAATGIITKAKVVIVGTRAQIEGVVAHLFRNEGMGAIDPSNRT